MVAKFIYIIWIGDIHGEKLQSSSRVRTCLFLWRNKLWAREANTSETSKVQDVKCSLDMYMWTITDFIVRIMTMSINEDNFPYVSSQIYTSRTTSLMCDDDSSDEECIYLH